MQRQLAAVMFTDLVGYTATVRKDEEAGRLIRSLHRSTVERALDAHGGSLLQYFGDGSLSVFTSAVEAVSAAQEIQEGFGDGGSGALRIGIDLGDIAFDEQGAYGDAVNLASRLESLSEPGGILISGKVNQELRNHPVFETVPLGEIPLRNVDVPVPIFAVSGKGLRTSLRLPEGLATPPRPAVSPEPRPVADVVEALWVSMRPWDQGLSGDPLDANSPLQALPLVGREEELARLRAAAEGVKRGSGRTVFITGDRGVGKTRLADHLQKELVEGGWVVARGQAYLSEAGVPFGPFADAFGPLLSRIEPPELRVLAQGGAQDLAALWPPLARVGTGGQTSSANSGEARSRLFWTFSHFLATLTASRPLVLVLEDLQWADRSSLDLLHFLSRQISDKRVLVVAAFCQAEVEAGGRLMEVAQVLERTRLACEIRLEPLSLQTTKALVTSLFQVPSTVIEDFARRLFERTRGNPFFLEGTLQGLMETGHLSKRQGRWLGWEVREIPLPTTIQDAIALRVGRLSPEAKKLAELAAVMGGSVSYTVLAASMEEGDADVVGALDELVRRGVLVEVEVDDDVHLRFTHPLIPETLEARLPLAVARSLHGRVAEALEDHYGPAVGDHVDELAYHYARAHGSRDSMKATRYLAAAGRKALGRNAQSEAARYLEAALSRLQGAPKGEGTAPESGTYGLPSVDRLEVLEDLARARAQIGDQNGAIRLWTEAMRSGEEGTSGAKAPKLFRKIGQAHLSQGRLAPALEAIGDGIAAARGGGDRLEEARLLQLEGFSMQQAGRSAHAREAVELALKIADELQDRRLLAGVNRTSLLIHLWNGDLDLVSARGLEVRRMAAEIADDHLLFWSEWTLAATAGLRGNTEELLRRVQELERLSDRLRSPNLRLWAMELSLEYAYASGAWDVGMGLGEQAASLGRALSERAILPRILVCLSFIYAARGEMDRAEELVDEAWAISGAAGVAAGVEFLNVHTVVPAHIGRAFLLTAREDWEGAIEVAAAGLEVADRTGYVLWGIHRLLPLLGEACLQAGHVERAAVAGERLRECGEALDHDLARAWGTACEALLAWQRGDPRRGAALLGPAAEALERIPLVFDAARIRRQLAGRLHEIGDLEAARAELEGVLLVFERLGAVREAEKTRIQMTEVARSAGG